MSKVTVSIKTRTAPGKRGEAFALYEKHLAERALANTGQEFVGVSFDAMDPDVLYLYEVFSDQATFEANGQAPWFWEYMSAVGPLLAGQPEMGMGSLQWAKGIAV